MYDAIIRNYIINSLTKDEIKRYALKNNISLSDTDATIIYNFIKEEYNELLKGNEKVLEKLETKLDNDLYIRAVSLYKEAKNKFLN